MAFIIEKYSTWKVLHAKDICFLQAYPNSKPTDFFCYFSILWLDSLNSSPFDRAHNCLPLGSKEQLVSSGILQNLWDNSA